MANKNTVLGVTLNQKGLQNAHNCQISFFLSLISPVFNASTPSITMSGSELLSKNCNLGFLYCIFNWTLFSSSFFMSANIHITAITWVNSYVETTYSSALEKALCSYCVLGYKSVLTEALLSSSVTVKSSIGYSLSPPLVLIHFFKFLIVD